MNLWMWKITRRTAADISISTTMNVSKWVDSVFCWIQCTENGFDVSLNAQTNERIG